MVQTFDHTSFESKWQFGSYREKLSSPRTELSEFEVDQGEEVTSLHAFTATLSGTPSSFLCVGVTSYNAGEREPSQGKLVLLQANGSRAFLVVMASVSVKGCVYAITSVQNMILAAVNSSVGIIVSFCKHRLTTTSSGHAL